MNFSFWCWPPFGSHFEGVLGAQMEAKAIRKPLQKNIKKMMPKMSPNWSQRGSQIGPKIINNEVLEAPCFKGGSSEASRAPPGSIWERFWDHFGTMFDSFSDIFFVKNVQQKETSREGLRNSVSLRAILHQKVH